MRATPTPEQITNAIRDSGYLMEQEVATELENLDFNVKTNSAFEDENEGKSREIDIFATKEFYRNKENKILINVGLICECKNNSNPFVFIGRNKNKADQLFKPKEFVFPFPKYHIPVEGENNMVRVVPAFNHLGIEKYHHFFLNTQKAVQFCKIVRKGKNWKALHDGIYDGIFLPLVKALEYQKKDLKKYTNYWNYIFLYYPMVILHSDLFYIDSNDNLATPVPVNHVTFEREIKSKTLDGRYLIEFVNQRGLSDFITQKIIPVIEHLTTIADSNPKMFKKSK